MYSTVHKKDVPTFPLFICEICICMIYDQKIHNIVVAQLCSQHQWCAALLVLYVRMGSQGQTELYQVFITVQRGLIQGPEALFEFGQIYQTGYTHADNLIYKWFVLFPYILQTFIDLEDLQVAFRHPAHHTF